jgi:glucose 1-dehydrogenase
MRKTKSFAMTGRTDIAIAPEMLAYATARTLWPRLGDPADIASTATFLASDMPTYLTGVNLLVDGGWMAG